MKIEITLHFCPEPQQKHLFGSLSPVVLKETEILDINNIEDSITNAVLRFNHNFETIKTSMIAEINELYK